MFYTKISKNLKTRHPEERKFLTDMVFTKSIDRPDLADIYSRVMDYLFRKYGFLTLKELILEVDKLQQEKKAGNIFNILIERLKNEHFLSVEEMEKEIGNDKIKILLADLEPSNFTFTPKLFDSGKDSSLRMKTSSRNNSTSQPPLVQMTALDSQEVFYEPSPNFPRINPKPFGSEVKTQEKEDIQVLINAQSKLLKNSEILMLSNPSEPVKKPPPNPAPPESHEFLLITSKISEAGTENEASSSSNAYSQGSRDFTTFKEQPQSAEKPKAPPVIVEDELNLAIPQESTTNVKPQDPPSKVDQNEKNLPPPAPPQEKKDQ